jgi:hypothetical protein
MKKIVLIILTFACSLCNAQNLVNNWSFEDTVACPNSLTQIDRATGWTAYKESPDYFNSCSPNVVGGVSVPENVWGYQYAKSGNGYAGFTAFGSSTTNSREYLGCQLNQQMQIGQKYFVSFYVCRAHNGGFQWACNNIGMQFSTISFLGFPTNSSPAPINNFAHIHDTIIISDTVNWIKISDSFIADSNYNYVILGNFFVDSLTQSMQIGPNLGYAYYYIDDIKVSTDSNFVNAINEVNSSNNMLNIIPNPARDWIEVRGDNISLLEIIDISGRILLTTKDIISPVRINISNYANGIYIMKAFSQNKLITNKFIKF